MYQFRRRVPKDCQAVLGKREWNQTLETKDLKTAERAILKYIIESDEQIQAIRSGSYRRFDDVELEQIAMAWGIDFHHQLAQYEMLPPTTQDFTDEVTGPITSEAELDESIQRYLDRTSFEIQAESPDYKALRNLCFDEHYWGHVAALPKPLERLAGEPVKVDPKNGPSLLETFESYLLEAQPRDRTEQEYRKSIGDFMALHGGDMAVAAVNKGMVVNYKDLLLKRPKHITAKQKKLNLRELAELEGDHEILAGASINKALAAISVTLEYAVKNGRIETNPAHGVKVLKSKTSKKRLPYSIEDLNLIFSNPVLMARKDEKSWLPLLALWTGARLEELAQLYVSDIQEQDGIHYLNIAEIEEGQTVKNENSVRRVPLHPKLIDLGFLDYVRSRNSKMVFELRPYRGRYSHAFSKWYGRFVRAKVGITDSRKTFHSYRHALKDAGREAGLDKAIVDALQGHSDGSVSGGYGSGYSLAALDREMKQIRYPGLRLKA